MSGYRTYVFIDGGHIRSGLTRIGAQWENLNLRAPEQVAVREANKRRLTERLDHIEGVSTLRQDERISQPSGYGFYFRYHAEAFHGVPRDKLIAALWHEGIPCAGAFYEPVYKDPLFAWRDTGIDAGYSELSCPNAERAAYEQSVWLSHELFLGDEADIDDIATAIEKITTAWRENGP